MEEGRRTDRLNKIKKLAIRWLEIKGRAAHLWDITTTMHIYADDCIVNVEYRLDIAMSWNPRNITASP